MTALTLAFFAVVVTGAALCVWRTIVDTHDDWTSDAWRNRQTAAKYDARFRERYPK